MSRDQRRRAARIILTDHSGNVLLLRGEDPTRPEAGSWWFTPGGGAADHETMEAAGKRELFEETGLDVDDLGPVMLTRSTDFEFAGTDYEQDEVYFWVRTDQFVVDRKGWTQLEQRVVKEIRWWSLQELRATTETVYPEELCAMLEGLGVKS